MSIVLENVVMGIVGAGLTAAWLVAALGHAAVSGSTPAAGEEEASGADAGRDTRAAVLRRWFWGTLLLTLAAATALLIAASVDRGGVAVYNQAEFLFAMSWVTTLALAYFVRRGAPWALPVAVLPVALLLVGGAILVPAGSGEVRPAALTSGWLLLHILTSIVAYASFTVTFAAGVVTLSRHYFGRPSLGGIAARPSGAADWPARAAKGPARRGTTLERVGYQAAVFGFPFMTMVLFTGAVWAKFVWGRYWAWDPIEAWALVTWLVYAAYLHAQYSRRWGGVRSAWLAVAGFGCVIATYLFFTHLWF